MIVSSPLGGYGPLVASVTAIGVLVAYVIALLVGNANAAQLQPLALVAIGWISGSTASNLVTSKGIGRALAALSARLDSAGIPAAGEAHQ